MVPPPGRPVDPGRSRRDRRSQRFVAVVLTLLLFGLIVVGASAVFAIFGHRGWGYVAGALICVVMAIAGWRTRDR